MKRWTLFRSNRGLALLVAGAMLVILVTGSTAATQDRPRVAGAETGISELPEVAQYAISAAVGRDQRSYHITESPGGFRATHAGHRFAADFGANGVEIRADAVSLRLRLTAFGFGDEVRPVAPPRLRANENRLEYQRGSLSEWYVNGPLGLQQGFTLQRGPGKDEATAMSLVLGLSGDLRAVVDSNGTGLTFVDAAGTARLRYQGLAAYDADDRPLPARLEAEDGKLRIHVDATGARYPVVIDPLVETVKLVSLDGEREDQFGYSVAIDGNTLVVGANGKGSMAGAAYVFLRSPGGSNSIRQVGKLTAKSGKYFGSKVAISGGTVVIANWWGASGMRVYLFEKPTNGWTNMTETAQLSMSDPGGEFAYSIAVSGDTVVVGQPVDGGLPYPVVAGAYVFVKPTTGWKNMTETAKLQRPSFQSSFAKSVAVSGDTVVVGAETDNSRNGSAHVYVKPSGGWMPMSPTATLTASDGATGDRLGNTVAIDGNTIVAGAPGDDMNQGSAYIFVKPKSGWTDMTETGKLTASDGKSSDYFPYSIAVDGDAVVAGCYSYSKEGAYIFIKPKSGWANATETMTLTGSDTVNGDQFGFCTAVSGSTVLVGAPHDDVGANTDQGSAYVFDLVRLTGSGTPKPGGTIHLDLSALLDAGLPYQLASSFGTGPIPIDTRQIALSPDWLLMLTIWNVFPTIFSSYAGTIDAQGTAKAAMCILNEPALVGYQLHTAFVTISSAAPSGIKSISNTYSFKITN